MYDRFINAWQVNLLPNHNKIGGIELYTWGMHFDSDSGRFGTKVFRVNDNRGKNKEVRDLLRERICKLIDVKSIVTITLVVTLVSIVLGSLDVKDNVFQLFSSSVMLVLGFFFGKNLNNEFTEGEE